MCTTQVQMRTQEKERTERSICRRVVVSTRSQYVLEFLIQWNSIIPRARVGYEMINSWREAFHFISNVTPGIITYIYKYESIDKISKWQIKNGGSPCSFICNKRINFREKTGASFFFAGLKFLFTTKAVFLSLFRRPARIFTVFDVAKLCAVNHG